ncbi:hypothetical protein [Psychrobacter jeotgali]|uniref:hypothetical protein n=1 Tax=Psychrobacter jeotgali TaxID=179010 RepID=UPI0019180CB7|nr:hypothetical protein [Psychrobacter jeotgali]
MQNYNHKKWLFGIFAAAALTLSACADKEPVTPEPDPSIDAQTEVEQQATGVATADTANASVANDDVAVATATDDVTNDDIGIATADDSEVLDGTESQEHVSTY